MVKENFYKESDKFFIICEDFLSYLSNGFKKTYSANFEIFLAD